MNQSLFIRHVRSLVRKETRQILRDKSTLILGIVMPMMLILFFGFGLSFDVRNVQVGIVDSVGSAQTSAWTHAMQENPLLITHVYDNPTQAYDALHRFEEEAIVLMQSANHDNGVQLQILVDGIDATRANMISQALQGILSTRMMVDMDRNGVSANVSSVPITELSSGLTLTPRIWFNESAESRWYLIPGLFVIILTMVGCMLTSLVIAREWERGTMEALISTPITPLALLVSKAIPYFFLGMLGFTLCLLMGLFVFEVPVRGSLTVVFVGSCVYMLLSLGLGLLISAVTRSQFLASQMTLLVSFLPALLLSGMIFDTRTMPLWASMLAQALPPYYYMDLLKIGFLTGGVVERLVLDLCVLLGFALLFFWATLKHLHKRID